MRTDEHTTRHLVVVSRETFVEGQLIDKGYLEDELSDKVFICDDMETYPDIYAAVEDNIDPNCDLPCNDVYAKVTFHVYDVRELTPGDGIYETSFWRALENYGLNEVLDQETMKIIHAEAEKLHERQTEGSPWLDLYTVWEYSSWGEVTMDGTEYDEMLEFIGLLDWSSIKAIGEK